MILYNPCYAIYSHLLNLMIKLDLKTIGWTHFSQTGLTFWMHDNMIDCTVYTFYAEAEFMPILVGSIEKD
jgi:hypothetical protein